MWEIPPVTIALSGDPLAQRQSARSLHVWVSRLKSWAQQPVNLLQARLISQVSSLWEVCVSLAVRKVEVRGESQRSRFKFRILCSVYSTVVSIESVLLTLTSVASYRCSDVWIQISVVWPVTYDRCLNNVVINYIIYITLLEFICVRKGISAITSGLTYFYHFKQSYHYIYILNDKNC